MAKKVFIGVGHGGSDSGAVANNIKEKDLNLSIALACRDELVRHGVTVVMSRVKDENDTLNEEIKECNACKPDVAVDIHNNAASGKGDGAEAFYHYKGGVGKKLAESILNELVKIGQNSRGAKTRLNDAGRDWYGFIRSTTCPATIVEVCFLDNAKDLAFIDTEPERKAAGIAIAKGILKVLEVEYIPEKKEEPQKTPSTANAGATNTGSKTIYRVQMVGAYSKRENAEAMCAKLKAAGFDAVIV